MAVDMVQQLNDALVSHTLVKTAQVLEPGTKLTTGSGRSILLSLNATTSVGDAAGKNTTPANTKKATPALTSTTPASEFDLNPEFTASDEAGLSIDHLGNLHPPLRIRRLVSAYSATTTEFAHWTIQEASAHMPSVRSHGIHNYRISSVYTYIYMTNLLTRAARRGTPFFFPNGLRERLEEAVEMRRVVCKWYINMGRARQMEGAE